MLRALSEAWDATAIDFARLTSTEPQVAHRELAVTGAGVAHAVAWWWELDMGGGHALSSWSPAEPADGTAAARHHWKPCLSFLAPRRVERGETVGLAAVHSDEAIWFAWHASGSPKVPPRWVEGVTHVPPERERLLMAGSEAWAAPLVSCAAALGASAAGREGGVLLLPAGDALLLPRLAESALASGARASAVVSARTARRLREAGRLPEGLGVIASPDAAAGEAPGFDALLAEPFAPGPETPWELLCHVRAQVQAVLPLLAPGARALPCRASLVAVLVQCCGVWSARQPLSDICGTRMALANPALVPAAGAPLTCPLCEMAWRPLSAPAEVLVVDLVSAATPGAAWRGSCTLTPSADGECHAVALWATFDLDGGVLSTGPPDPGCPPTGWTQALRLLAEPLRLAAGEGALRLGAELSQDSPATLWPHPPMKVGLRESRRLCN